MRTYEFAAPRVRHLVADCLRTGVGHLAPEVSLTKDLAAYPVELAITLGVEFGIAMPERMLDRVYQAEARGAESPPFIWTRVLERGRP